MNRSWMKGVGLFAAVMAVFFLALSAQAQMMGKPGERERMHPRMGMPGYGGGPYGRAPFDIEMFQDYLQLSDEQVGKMRKIRQDYRKEMIKRRANLRVAEIELWDIIDTKDLDLGKAEKKVKEIQAMETDLMMYRIKALQETRGFLTEEQYEMFRDMGFRAMRHMSQRHGMMSGGMKGGMGGGMMGGMGEDYD